MVRFEIEENAQQSKCLPLSKWAHDGFDADAIRKGARKEDIEVHPQFGLTFRASIHTTMTAERIEEHRSQIVKHMNKRYRDSDQEEKEDDAARDDPKSHQASDDFFCSTRACCMFFEFPLG